MAKTYTQNHYQTDRLNIAAYRHENPGKPKLMLVHGNASSSIFYVPLMERLKENFDLVVPDLRGFGQTEALPVSAVTGMKDWSDDLASLADTLGWDKFAIMGWSLGGAVAEKFTIDHTNRLTALLLEAPCPPYGFGGTRDVDGTLLEPANIGSGAATTSKALCKAMQDQDRDLIRTVIQNVYVQPSFKMDPEWLEAFVDGVLQTKLGEDWYPGNVIESDVWPYAIAGDKGICNTMAPLYCNMKDLPDIQPQIPILCFFGNNDVIVSDYSGSDINVSGARGLVAGWPGPEICPPQPMMSQTLKLLDTYEKNGGKVKVIHVDNAGHGIHLEQEEQVARAIEDFLKA